MCKMACNRETYSWCNQKSFYQIFGCDKTGGGILIETGGNFKVFFMRQVEYCLLYIV